MNEVNRLKHLAGIVEYKKEIRSKSQKRKKTSMFELPEFKLTHIMRNNDTLKSFSKKEIEDFFNVHDRSNKSPNS